MDVTIPYRFKVLANTAAALAADPGIPRERELVFEIDTGYFKIGDGTTGYSALAYAGAYTAALTFYDNTTSGLTATDVQSAIDEIAAGGAGSGSGGTDDFKFNSISSYSIYGDTPGTWAVSTSSDVIIATGVGQSILVRNGVLFADGVVSCGINQAADAGLVLRATYKDDYYLAAIKDASAGATNNEIRIYKRVAGTFTQLGSTAVIAFTRNTLHTFSFEANGTSLIAKFDGVTKVSVTDSSITAAGKAGLRAGSGSNNQFDSFTWP